MLSLAQKRSRLLLALGALLLALLLVKLLMPGAEPTPRLSTLQASEVSRLTFSVRGGQTVAMAKTDGDWHITQPWNRRADASRVQILLSLLTLPASTIYSPDDLSLSEAGLAEPAATLTIDDTTFLLGNADTTQRRRYVQSGEQIALLSDLAYPVMQQQPEYFANMRVFAPGLTAISTPEWQVAKPDRLWQSPELSQTQSEALVRRWLDIRAARILPWPLPARQLPDAVEAVPVSVKTPGQTLGYVFYQLEDVTLIHADSADHVMAVEPAAADALLRVPGDA